MLQGFLQIGLTLAIAIAIAPLLGSYIARVFQGQSTWFDRAFVPVERLVFTLGDIRPETPMTAWQYARAVLLSNLVMGIFVFLLLVLQGNLPLNVTGLGVPSWDLALHTTISFATNTDQQHYAGETTLSYLSQTVALGFLFFTSAATGIAVAIAFIRGLSGYPLGNFYQDVTLSLTRILLPLALVGSILLLLLGVPETLAPPAIVTTLEGATQAIARGPVAHYEIVKQLGENGGGFFGANSAHPLENPNAATNLLETLAMLVVPSSLILTFGIMSGHRKQGWMLFWMVMAIAVVLIVAAAVGEFQGNPIVNGALGVKVPNMEGKEVRFGWAQSALWAIVTTGTMCGAVNGMHDSLMPPAGFATLFNLFLQIVWGGQGTGTAYIYVFLILTVFLTGLMVGRTPEFLGRKIEKREIVLASTILLVHPIAVLLPAAIALVAGDNVTGIANVGISNSGFHGLTQVIYEYASAAANNGSGLEGLGDGNPWWNLTTSFSLLMGRYVPILALIFLADGMSKKQQLPLSPGTLGTDTILFTTVTAGSILILGALTFFPVLALGPIAEAFQL